MRRKRSNGSILILALWAVCLLAALAVILGYEVRQKIRLAYRIDEKERLSLVAEAGVMQALSLVATADEKAWHALSDPWSVNEPLFRDVSVAGGTFRVGYDYAGERDAVQTRFGLIDEERKINLNTAPAAILSRLCLAVGMGEADSQSLAACIVDWRDPDSDVVPPALGAEDSYYRSLPDPYDAKDAPFGVPEELMLVKGMTADVYHRLADHVTVYGSGKVNINTAGEPVLAALGLSQGVIADILAFRAGRDGVPGTADDGFFDSPLTITQKITQSNALSQDEMIELANVSSTLLTTSSTAFLAVSRAYGPGGKVPGATVRAVIDHEGGILYWQESSIP